MKDGEPIEHPWLTKAIENAQKKVEAHNFDIRKNLLEYDDVMNQQRKSVYRLRRMVLGVRRGRAGGGVRRGSPRRRRRPAASRSSPGPTSASTSSISSRTSSWTWSARAARTALRLGPRRPGRDGEGAVRRRHEVRAPFREGRGHAPRDRGAGLRGRREAVPRRRRRSSASTPRACRSSGATSSGCTCRPSTSSGRTTCSRWTTCARASACAATARRTRSRSTRRKATRCSCG